MKKIYVSKWWFFIIIVLFLSIGICITTYQEKSETFTAFKESLDQFQNNVSRLKYRPDDITLQQLRTTYKILLEKNKEFYEILDSYKIPHEDLAPLEFKERLIDMADRLNKLAKVQGINMPSHIGFPKYISGDIPAEEEVPRLYKELLGIEVVLKILLKYKVEDIDVISRDEKIIDGHGGTYKEYRVKFRFKVDYPNLVSIMREIFTTPNFLFIVERLEVCKVKGNKNITTLVLGLVDFNLESFK